MNKLTWPLRRIGDCAKFLSGGTPSKARADFWEGDIPWVSSGEMGETRIHDTPLHITADGAEDGSRLVPANTVLAVVRGMSLAKEFRVALTKREVAFNQDLKALTCKPDVDAVFLYYALFARREHIRELATEASHGTKKLETETLASVEIHVPKLEIQHRVAEAASSYDDLMENNRRRMALLEESTRQLYREWFVRLRYPGHEHAPATDDLPAGWRKVTLGAICSKVGSGSTPRGGSAAYLTEGITLIRSMNVYDDRFEDDGLAFIDDEQAADLDNVTVQSRDILLNITGASVARCCMAPDRYLPARVNQHVMILRADPAKADPFLVHAAINSDERKRQLLSYARKGSTREALTKETMSAFEIVLPTDALMRRFGEIAEVNFRQRETLALQNQKLRAARDHLLPRLLSGELAV